MSKVRETHSRTYIAQLESNRPAQLQRQKKLALEAPNAPLFEGANKDAHAIFTRAKVPEKHRALFAGATEELAGIAKLVGSLDGFREKQVSRTLEQLYKVLATALGRVPEAERAAVANRSLAAMRSLAEEIGSNQLLTPAMTAAIGLADVEVRLAAKGRSNAEPQTLFEDACAAVKALSAAIEGRRSTSAAINVFAPLVERVLLSYPKIERADRDAVISAVTGFLTDTAPRGGFDLAMVARFAELISRAIDAKPGEVKTAIADASEAFLADRRGLQEQARAGLGAPPEAVPGQSPALAAARIVLQKALLAVVDANPAGSDAFFESIDQLRAITEKPDPKAPPPPAVKHKHRHRHLQKAPPKPPPSPAPVFEAVAPLVERFQKSPAAAALIAFIAERTDAFAAQPFSQAALTAAANADSPAALAKAMLDAELAVRTAKAPELPADVRDALAKLAELPETTALQVTLAFLPAFRKGRGDGALLATLIDRAKETRPDDPLAYFASIAERYNEIVAASAPYPGIKNDVAAIAKRIASDTAGLPIDAESLKSVLGTAQLVKHHCPLIAVANLVGPDALGAMLDTRLRFARPVPDVLGLLLPKIKPAAANDRELQTSLASTAVKIAIEAAQIAGGKKIHHVRISADWDAALADPAKLHTAARAKEGVALRAAVREQSVPSFLEAHPELPVDFALTAGLHLNPEQLAWAIDRIATSRGRDTARALRDFTFACVELNRLDLLEAARTSKSTPKAISAVITAVAQRYRNGQAKDVEYDRLVEGLNAGGDPYGEDLKTKSSSTLAALKLDELGVVDFDPRGVAEIRSIAANIADLLEQYTKEFKSTLDHELDMSAFRPIFLACLRSVAQGTWPAPKYENDVGKRIMAQLSPEQQELWKQSMLTADAGGAPLVTNENLLSSAKLAGALLRAIPMELPGMTFDAAALEETRAARDETLAKLHDAEKGSKTHRDLGKELGSASAQVAVIELMLALEQTLGGGRAAQIDPRVALTELLAPLTAAGAALKKLGATGSGRAVAEILESAGELDKKPVRSGKYATDEDGLVALVDSNKTGCLAFGDKRRRWGIAGALADPNIRMLRVYEGEKQRYRVFMKFFTVELPGYKGPALWLDNPKPDGGGGPEELALLYKHAFAKARAMGIPVISKDLGQAPKDWKPQATKIVFHIDDGNTGYMHSDTMFGGKGAIRASRGKNATWVMKAKFQVAMPPK